MYTDLSVLTIRQERSLLEAMRQMDQSRLGIVLAVDQEGRLTGTITDGDVRRAILAIADLTEPVSMLIARKAGTKFERPITAPAGAERSMCLELFKRHNVLALPIVGPGQRVVGLVTMEEFLPEQMLPVHAIVMAGGQGSRLRPLTEHLPKPMLPVGDRPLLEIIIRQLREAGIKRVKVTTHHRPEKITEHFGDGREFGVELSYVEESRPLGTVGGLGLLPHPTETTLVINGDILTDVDFRAMLSYHREHEAELTVAVRQYDLKVPYGVVGCEGSMGRKISEKPVFGVFVNAGIYLLEPAVYRFIQSGERCDMTDLIERLLKEGRPVASFPVREYWLDVGEHAGYEQAAQDVRTGKVSG